MTVPFSANLRRAMRRAGLRQRDVASAVGVGPVTVCRWAHGATRPSYEDLIALSDLLGVTVDSLLRPTEGGDR